MECTGEIMDILETVPAGRKGAAIKRELDLMLPY